MEKVANSVLFPCKYASSGCEVTLPHTEKTEHEELCEFRPYSCPCPGASCKWQGSLDAVMPHLMHQHKSITTLQVRPRPLATAAAALTGLTCVCVCVLRGRTSCSWPRTSTFRGRWTGS